MRPFLSHDHSPDGSSERLRWLRRRISGDDRNAFVELFDRLSGPLRDGLGARLADPPCAEIIITATFVEVWWLAGCHSGPETDVVAWINRIVDRRVGELRPLAAQFVYQADFSQLTPGVLATMRARRAELELAALLGRPDDTPVD
jgi:hypothetical protein